MFFHVFFWMFHALVLACFVQKTVLDFFVFVNQNISRAYVFLWSLVYDFVHVTFLLVTFFLLFLDFLLVTFLYLCLWLWFFTCDFFLRFLNSCHNTNIRSNITESQVPTFQGKTNLSYVLVCLFFGGGSTKWWMCWSGWKSCLEELGVIQLMKKSCITQGVLRGCFIAVKLHFSTPWLMQDFSINSMDVKKVNLKHTGK